MENIDVIYARHSENDSIRPDWKHELTFNANNFEAKDKRILLIDDIVGTGKTIKRALVYCNKKNPINIKTSCLFLNKERFNGDNYLDYTVEQTKDWIVFPWEKDYLYGGDKK